MAWTSTASPICGADDWLVVGSDDSTHEAVSTTSSSKTDETDGNPHTSQAQSQGLDTQEPKVETFRSDTKQVELNLCRKRRTEIYKLLVWSNELETPMELVDAAQKPLNVATESCLTQEMVQELVLGQPQLCQMFPNVTKMNIADMLQVCMRSNDEQEWVLLQSTEDEEDTDAIKQSTLQLTSQRDQSDGNRYCQILIETKFETKSDQELMDWRYGRFFSDIQRHAWRFELQIGQSIDALDTEKRWYESRIVDTSDVYVKVHYRGWTSKWDEWLRRTSARLAPLHTKVPIWRDFHVNDELLVGTEVSSRSYPEWRYARVTACAVEGGSLQIEVNVDGKKKWMDAQDELLCQNGTHKAINASANGKFIISAVPHTLLVNYFDRPRDLPPSREHRVDHVESIRRVTRAMRLADSPVNSDEWYVVDINDEDCIDGKPTTATKKEVKSGSKAPISIENDDAAGDTRIQSRPDTVNGHNLVTNANDQINVLRNEDNHWRYELRVGQLVDARDTDSNWYESRVVALSSRYVKLHYRGWTSKWDEWLECTSTRIAPLHSKVRNWRAFKAGDGVMVGRYVGTKKYPEWRNAIVTNCEASKVNGSRRIEVKTGGCSLWMDTQDEMLCPLATHKAVNSLFHVAPLF